MGNFPILKTDRLLLRQLNEKDAAAILRNFSDEAVTRWFFDEPFKHINQAEELIAEFNDHFSNSTGITWAITLLGNNDVIGTCGIEPYESGDRGEIGFDLAQVHWGKGLMSEALRAIIGYGFNSLSLKCIDADTYCDNKRSIVLLEHLGFSRLRQVHDYYQYSLKREALKHTPDHG